MMMKKHKGCFLCGIICAFVTFECCYAVFVLIGYFFHVAKSFLKIAIMGQAALVIETLVIVFLLLIFKSADHDHDHDQPDLSYLTISFLTLFKLMAIFGLLLATWCLIYPGDECVGVQEHKALQQKLAAALFVLANVIYAFFVKNLKQFDRQLLGG